MSNYTDTETEEVIRLYIASDYNNDKLPEIADTLGKTVKSVRAKLSNAKVYIKRGEKTTRTQKSKKDLVNLLEQIVHFDCTGLMPSKREALYKLLEFVRDDKINKP